MLNRKRLEWIIEILESARQRKQMYLDPVNLDTTVNFFNGFDVAFFAMGHRDNAAYVLAVEERGWKYNSTTGVWKEMERAGMTEQSIVDELFAIEIETWKIKLRSLPS